MEKIVMITLDERPCNYVFPQMMPKADYHLVIPPKHIMGDKKNPADVVALRKWLIENIKDAYAAVISLDTLIYGGIVPSRLHQTEFDILIERARIIEEIKMINPLIKLFAFQLIMRCPWYSLSDEEPDYYDDYGSEIHRYGKYSHLEKLDQLSNEDKTDFELVKNKLDMNCLNDYVSRRDKNIAVLMHNLEYLKNGLIDFFIVPQDDSAVHGFTSLDQMKVREFIKTNGLHRKTAMYPSADDTGLTLLARAITNLHRVKPKIYVYYASSKGAFVIPSFEDRIVDETIKFHILAVNGQRVYSLEECDILLAVNIGSAMLNKDEAGYITAYDIERNLSEYIGFIEYALEQGKVVSVADVAHCNGGDNEMVQLLRDSDLLFKISAYAGWNTSSNTLGTTICQAILYMIGKDEKTNKTFLVHRYFEDIAYCSYARSHVTEHVLKDMELDYFNVNTTDGAVASIVKNELLHFMSKNYPIVFDEVYKLEVKMPWRRMFEVDIKITTKGSFHDENRN